MTGPNDDAFAPLLTNSLDSDLCTVLNSYYHFAISSPEDKSFTLLGRFLVTTIGIKKASSSVQHESVSIWVQDQLTLKQHEFTIERVPSVESNPKTRLISFCQSPFSNSIIESIKNTLTGRTVRTADLEEVVALLPLTNTDDPRASSPHPSTPSKSFIDTLTSTIARAMSAVRIASDSVSPPKLARDSISGHSSGTLNPNSCIHRFNPVGLSLFDILLLGYVVHTQAPMYGLFDNQCYLFSSVIFDSIVQLFSLPRVGYTLDPSLSPSTSGPVPAPTLELWLPRNANLILVPDEVLDSDEAGRWCHMLIVDPHVKSTIVGIVISIFREERASYMQKLRMV